MKLVTHIKSDVELRAFRPTSVVLQEKVSMHKVTRISYNSSGWRKPTGEAREFEDPDTYNYKNGFGHEDWLFRTEWLIDGWRYAFLQGVNKSHATLVDAGEPFDLTLFTIAPEGRRYVATIAAAECLDDEKADLAYREIENRGWLDVMRREIDEVGGNSAALGAWEWARYVLNVRFRLENLAMFPSNTFAAPDDPVNDLQRYSLSDAANVGESARSRSRRQGSTVLPPSKAFRRRAVDAVDCTPEHALMQAKLMQELRKEFPDCTIIREQDYIDVSVRTDSKLMLFEIKSDLSPRTVIRQALGQILEYAYHPCRGHDCSVELVIVGRRSLDGDDAEYLKRLQDEFGLPVNYRVVEI